MVAISVGGTSLRQTHIELTEGLPALVVLMLQQCGESGQGRGVFPHPPILPLSICLPLYPKSVLSGPWLPESVVCGVLFAPGLPW